MISFQSEYKTWIKALRGIPQFPTAFQIFLEIFCHFSFPNVGNDFCTFGIGNGKWPRIFPFIFFFIFYIYMKWEWKCQFPAFGILNGNVCCGFFQKIPLRTGLVQVVRKYGFRCHTTMCNFSEKKVFFCKVWRIKNIPLHLSSSRICVKWTNGPYFGRKTYTTFKKIMCQKIWGKKQSSYPQYIKPNNCLELT